MAGLPTPDWRTAADDRKFDPPYIIKAIGEHGSFGLGDDSVVLSDGDGLTCIQRIDREAQRLGRACFAERYVAGREFNLSLLAANNQCEVLPPAEIDFSNMPSGRLPIVGYDAKWTENSAEYRGTPRTFAFSEQDGVLLTRLEKLAEACWTLFGLGGYARVDFRVAAAGDPWILEINANPCLSPDAGFAAAATRASLSFADVVRRILADARARPRLPVMLC
jgi:D-alanine-D-alanine ligase